MSSSRSSIATWSLTEPELLCCLARNFNLFKTQCSCSWSASTTWANTVHVPLSSQRRPSNSSLVCRRGSSVFGILMMGDHSFPSNHKVPQKSQRTTGLQSDLLFSVQSILLQGLRLYRVNKKLFHWRSRWILILAVCSSIRFIPSDTPIWASSLWSASARAPLQALEWCWFSRPVSDVHSGLSASPGGPS